jgi:HEAT repeat protein
MLTFRNVASVLAVGICVTLMPSALCSATLPQPAELFEQFENTTVFWEQFEVAKKIVALGDKSVLPRLEPWLHCEDMRRRGNAGFIFAKFGDDRGFQTIVSILDDRSTNRAIEARDDAGEPSPKMQIRADRYYAAHLLGDLRDVRAVPILIPLLKDEDVKYIVPWSLAEIGDKSAIPSLKNALGDESLTMRAAAQLALEKLERHRPD